MSVGQLPANQKSIGQMSHNQMFAIQMYVGQLSMGQLFMGQMCVGKMSLIHMSVGLLPVDQKSCGKSWWGFQIQKFEIKNLKMEGNKRLNICGKHISNVVALYLKCLRAFFDYL